MKRGVQFVLDDSLEKNVGFRAWEGFHAGQRWCYIIYIATGFEDVKVDIPSALLPEPHLEPAPPLDFQSGDVAVLGPLSSAREYHLACVLGLKD